MLENCRGKIDERIAHNILKTTLSNFTGDSSAWTNIGWGPSRKNVKGIAYLSTSTSPEMILQICNSKNQKGVISFKYY